MRICKPIAMNMDWQSVQGHKTNLADSLNEFWHQQNKNFIDLDVNVVQKFHNSVNLICMAIRLQTHFTSGSYLPLDTKKRQLPIWT